MTEASWGDALPPPKPRRVPVWLWFCGGGCLLALLLAGIAAKLGYDQVKDWGEAEAQMPVLRESLPADALPPETEFVFAIRFPMNMFVFRDARGFALMFFVANPGDADELRRTMLEPEFGGFGMGRRKDAAKATVRVQGRDVDGMRFVQERGSGQGGDAEGPSIVLEVGPEGGAQVVIVQITRAGSNDAITDEDVRMLLEPFHVGSER